MKLVSAAFMMVMLASVAAVVVRAIDFGSVIGLLGGPLLLLYAFCLLRLYRIRRKQGKKTPLPGHWELGTELWDPLDYRDKLWVVVFCCLMLLGALAVLRVLKDEPQATLALLPLAGFSAICYVMASYRNPKA